ncbi:MAG: amidophosphoribosyltransferase [Betaproteobacteria bacterium]|nr:amidophosphoribosyltransferase [Betaproteobacteria bacterium]NCA15753.1 amidophosphoribosyltransferase [Betaproteobacteria bacterium]
MCGVVGIVSHSAVNQLLYDALLLLQHRGQDAAGISTAQGKRIHLSRGTGLVRDVFRTRDMRNLQGDMGIGHVRYPTAGSALSAEEAQPFYVNAPFGIALGHNGNLTNALELQDDMYRRDRRHINTESDSEVLLNVFAHELQKAVSGLTLDPDAVFQAVSVLHQRAKGAYACVAMIPGFGIVGFRDPYGIRPLVMGELDTGTGKDLMLASESVAMEGLGFKPLRDIAPGECVILTEDRQVFSRQCAQQIVLNPCVFEYVYFARPDSVMDGISVYDARLKMGETLAAEVARRVPSGAIDVVMPIPDSSRPAALQLAMHLNVPYREGFIKNRYVGRTFIMPGQEVRRKSVRQKLNAMASEFRGKRVLIVDDSIVRGTTSREIVSMARESGARGVVFASAAPPVRFPNVYGIDMPTRQELIAHERSDAEICKAIGADELIYQSIESMRDDVQGFNAKVTGLEASCFDGHYITGDVTPELLDRLEAQRRHG